MAIDEATIRWGEKDLVAAIVQNDASGAVLMLGYMNPVALAKTLDTGLVHFWSRSRNRIWQKGESSGNTLSLVSITQDCDGDALLVTATPAGPTCHHGTLTCFDRDGSAPLRRRGISRLDETIRSRASHRPDNSYTASLIDAGTDAVSRKVIEEAGEVVLAAKNHQHGGDPVRVVEEASDLLYHLLALLAERGLKLSDVENELDRRAAAE